MFHSILVGVASVERSEGAILTGLALARSDAATIQLVHAASVPPMLWPKSGPEQVAAVNAATLTAAWRRVRDPLTELLASVDGVGRSAEELLHVLPGAPAKVVLDRAQEIQADLIVLGPHEKRRLLDFGSTARAVLAKADCAVLVQPGQHRPFRRLLVPIDLSEESLQALDRARALAREHGARVVTLHCFATPDFAYASGANGPMAEPTYVLDEARETARKEYLEAMAALDWQGIDHEHVFEEGFPAQQILAHQDEVDLVVMGTHGRTGLAAAVLGSVAYGVLKHADVPVLAMRLPERKWLT